MKKFIFFTFLLFLFLIPQKVKAFEGKFKTDELIVKLKNQPVEEVFNRLNGYLGLKKKEKLLLPRTFVLQVPEGKVKEFKNTLSQYPLFDFIEPNYEATVQELTNDPKLTGQWGVYKIQAVSATESGFSFTHGNSNIKIAILDTGIDTNHEDLAGKVTIWKNFTSSRTLDDKFGHGTHVAGIAAAITNNNLGVAGVGYNSSLMSIKVLNDSGSGYYSWIANGIKFAADNEAKVINLSLGGYSSSQTLLDAINYAWGKGVVIAAAAANDNSTSKFYPCAYDKVICVAATDSNDLKASFSNYGSDWVDVAAPGDTILSTLTNHSSSMSKTLNYGYASGTSMATPFVSGLAGLVFSTSYGTDNNSVRQRIENTADQISNTGSYWSKGRINAYRAVGDSIVIITPTSTPQPTLTSTPTPTIIIQPTSTPTVIILPTSTPIPTATPIIPTSTPKPPTPTPTPTSTVNKPTPTPWYCKTWPQLCR